MEYFTLKQDVSDIRRRKVKKIIRRFLPVFIAGVFLFLRTYGFIALESHKLYIYGQQNSERELTDVYNEGTKIVKSQQHNDLNFKIETSNMTFSVLSDEDFDSGGTYHNTEDSVLENYIERELSRESINLKKFDFTFESSANFVSTEKFELTGFYWVPLIKNGKLLYTVEIRYSDFTGLSGIHNDSFFGKYEGEIDFQAYGICSIYRLKKELSKQITINITDQLKEDFKIYK